MAAERIAAILDVDGTLVDTNYQHAIAWHRAFRAHEIVVPLWRIHRHIGMGGDQLVGALTDEKTEDELGDDIRAAEKVLYRQLIHETEALDGARSLIERLRDLGHPVVLASSAKPDELDHYLDVLDARELATDWTSSGDVENTKPAPDLVQVALEKAGSDCDGAVMVGDSIWDCKAAERAKISSVGVLTGGFSEEELREAGASLVFESLPDLAADLDRVVTLGVSGS